jgi:hypothetical protein
LRYSAQRFSQKVPNFDALGLKIVILYCLPLSAIKPKIVSAVRDTVGTVDFFFNVGKPKKNQRCHLHRLKKFADKNTYTLYKPNL